MKKAKTYIDFSKDKIFIFEEKVLVKFSTLGHCIAVGKMNEKKSKFPGSRKHSLLFR